MADEEDEEKERKEYFPPKVVHTEQVTSRAVTCAKSDDAQCGGGPIQS